MFWVGGIGVEEIDSEGSRRRGGKSRKGREFSVGSFGEDLFLVGTKGQGSETIINVW